MYKSTPLSPLQYWVAIPYCMVCIVPVLWCVLKSSWDGRRPWPGFPDSRESGQSHCRSDQYISVQNIQCIYLVNNKKYAALLVFCIITVRIVQMAPSFHFQFFITNKSRKHADLFRPWQAVPRVRLRWHRDVAPLCTFSMSRGSSLKR